MWTGEEEIQQARMASLPWRCPSHPFCHWRPPGFGTTGLAAGVACSELLEFILLPTDKCIFLAWNVSCLLSWRQNMPMGSSNHFSSLYRVWDLGFKKKKKRQHFHSAVHYVLLLQNSMITCFNLSLWPGIGFIWELSLWIFCIFFLNFFLSSVIVPDTRASLSVFSLVYHSLKRKH